jgi:hypothetical protein
MQTQHAALEIGALCRSRDPIVRTLPDEDARLCRVVAAVPPERWRNPQLREFKVELLAMPVTAFLREDQLARLA